MRTSLKVLLFLLLATGLSFGQAAVEPGQQAPDFTLEDAQGNSVQLSSFRGEKAVVLEFFRSGDW